MFFYVRETKNFEYEVIADTPLHWLDGSVFYIVTCKTKDEAEKIAKNFNKSND